MTTQAAATAYLKERRAAGRISQQTAKANRGILVAFVEHCPHDPGKIRRRDVLRWMRTLGHLSAASRRRYYSVVHGFTQWLLGRGTLRKDPFSDLPAPKVPKPVHRCLAPTQVDALLAACATPRDRVVVLLGLHTGLRRAELADLEVGDVDLSARTVFVRHGKGDRPRTVPLSVEAAQVVGDYLASEAVRCGPLLRSVARPQDGICAQTVGSIVSTLAYAAGVKVRAWDGVGAHSMRHTMATNVHDATGDVVAVRDLLGHASLATTQVYVGGLSVERLRPHVEAVHYLRSPLRVVRKTADGAA